MGGNTARVLQHLMEIGHFNEAVSKLSEDQPKPVSPPYAPQPRGRWGGVPASRPSACWVKSITCISSPLNGTVFADYLGLVHRTDTNCSGDLRIRMGSLAHLCLVLIRVAIYFPSLLRFFGIDLVWDHWKKRRRREGFRGVLRSIFYAKDITLRMHASCVGDLSVKAAVRLVAAPGSSPELPLFLATFPAQQFFYVMSDMLGGTKFPDPDVRMLILFQLCHSALSKKPIEFSVLLARSEYALAYDGSLCNNWPIHPT